MNAQATTRLVLNQLAFTGPERQPTTLKFADGVNIIWGASNSGKSFVRKSVDYLLGGEKPSLPPEATGYDNFILWMTLPDFEKITLRSSVIGGDIYKAEGHTLEVGPTSSGYEVFKRKHVTAANVSQYLLSASGFSEAKFLKNERAQKTTFSLRMLMRYLLIDEARMISDKSIILGHNIKVTSEDKGLIKYLLTGVDGSSVEEVLSGDELKAAVNAKVELLAGMVQDLREKIDDSYEQSELPSILENAEEERDVLVGLVGQGQATLDEFKRNVGRLGKEVQTLESEASELRAMVYRFNELSKVYASDIERLKGLEEGGFLLQRFAKLNCPLCGADKADQKHDHGLSHVEEQRVTVEAEIKKIEVESAELSSAISSAESEIVVKTKQLDDLERKRATEQQGLSQANSKNVNTRSIFKNANDRVRELELGYNKQIVALEAQIDELKGNKIKSRQRADGIDANVELTESEAYELSKILKEILQAWNFPGTDAVHFNQKDHDIVVNGKRRKDNGAGVRALLHSAFKVSVLVHSIRKERPHPRFLILDSPLLAYREAEDNDVHGAVTDDEMQLREAGVADAFYSFLDSLKEQAQFIVIENHKSDQEVVAPYPNVQFTGNKDIGRCGLFYE